MIRILLADDHTMVRQGFRLILSLQSDMESSVKPATGNG
jgi:DNA-binding NarL/FixJ family response regulator